MHLKTPGPVRLPGRGSLMTEKQITIEIPDICRYNNLMRQKHPNYEKYGFSKYTAIESWTADFGNGLEIDLKVCTSDENDPLWCEAVLFHNGVEIGCSDAGTQLEGPWVFRQPDCTCVLIAKKPDAKPGPLKKDKMKPFEAAAKALYADCANGDELVETYGEMQRIDFDITLEIGP